MTRIAVIYYSSSGANHSIAEAFVAGAAGAGAEVRLRRVAELAPSDVVARNSAWSAHLRATDHIEIATPEDLAWADGFVLGAPTRFGQPAAQLRQFLDTTSGVWGEGHLAGKPATGFTSSDERHGGQEATLLALHHTFFHWGSIIVPMDRTRFGGHATRLPGTEGVQAWVRHDGASRMSTRLKR